MLESREFRQLLIADLAVARGIASAPDVAAALQRFWAGRERGDVSVADELTRIADLVPDALDDVKAEADRLISHAGGDAQIALTRRGGLDRSIHVALSDRGPHPSMVLSKIGAKARPPLRQLDKERYVEYEQAGGGGMGTVYQTFDTELSRWVALKIIRQVDANGDAPLAPASPLLVDRPPSGSKGAEIFADLKARFLQEAWVTAGLEHPGIPPVHELGETSRGVPYYTMKFVRGRRTLARALDEVRGLDVGERVKLLESLLKLCDAVAYAHAKGVIHRDLKPANVMLGDFGEVILIDWGLAKLEVGEDLAASRWQERIHEFREATDLRTISGGGTAGYMAPEAVLGRLDAVDARSDIYSLGVILYEILTGQLPFRFRTIGEYLHQISSEEAPPASALDAGVPKPLGDLAARCLARDPSLRPETVMELTHALRSWSSQRRYVDFLVAGKSGMGIVYMARDTELHRMVAIKMPRIALDSGCPGATPDSPADAVPPALEEEGGEAFEHLKLRLRHEAWVTAGLEHPGVVPVYEVGETPRGVPYYTMRAIRGLRTLAAALKEVRDAPVSRRLALLEPFLKLCDTVRYAHTRGVIHRDIKPMNVALGEFGEVQLLDWGLSILEGREDVLGELWQAHTEELRAWEASNPGALGTPGHMAPEAALGHVDEVGVRSDVYSLGVILYEILTGSHPFEFHSYGEYLRRVTTEDAPRAESHDVSVPGALSDLAARCLSRAPTARPQGVAEISESIRAWQMARLSIEG